MSEAIEGIPPAPDAPEPRDASIVMVYRQTPHGVEVFWIERERRLSFAGGFFALPGGKVDSNDVDVAVAGATGFEAQAIAAAARELFEETGLLVTRPALISADALDTQRRRLVGGTPFATVLHDLGVHLDAADFHPAGRWVTPAYLRTRFDARLFLVEAPASQLAQVVSGELVSGEWIRPEVALERWSAGTTLLHPPTLHALKVMQHFDSQEAVLERLRNPPWCEAFVSRHLEFQRGVHVVPLRTPTLPPATHTNAYVLGTGDLLIVDPGAPDSVECESLITVVRELEHDGARATAIVCTHHHQDHVGGLAIVSRALGLPVWAHAQTANRLSVPVARFLSDDEVIDLAGPLPMRWRVLHTPGHAAGHVCLVDERSSAGVVGDMVSSVSTIVIDPPEGNMATYVRQLERLKTRPLGTLYPAHGPVVPHGVSKFEEYLAHRAWREAKVLGVVRSFGVPTALDAIVRQAYDDVAAFIWPLAERNTVAILDKLVSEQRVLKVGQEFQAA
jgi:glyoxylase-like metal-dependent hydrolase (beta-lactamase superfamily II)/8-oxo-dGTP pyrophosphatase MutT (NUDIX family)